MKKICFAFFVIVISSSCSIFQKQKYGCPNDARGKSQEEIRDASAKKKYKGGQKF